MIRYMRRSGSSDTSSYTTFCGAIWLSTHKKLPPATEASRMALWLRSRIRGSSAGSGLLRIGGRRCSIGRRGNRHPDHIGDVATLLAALSWLIGLRYVRRANGVEHRVPLLID